MLGNLKEYLTGHVSLYNDEALNIFLQQMLSFAVAVEFVKMLIYHNPERVIDVLIFAITLPAKYASSRSR